MVQWIQSPILKLGPAVPAILEFQSTTKTC